MQDEESEPQNSGSPGQRQKSSADRSRKQGKSGHSPEDEKEQKQEYSEIFGGREDKNK